MTAATAASLSGQDLAFLAWESTARPMHIAATVDFERSPDAPVSVEHLRARLAPALAVEPMLSRRLIRRRFRTPRWGETEPIDVESHVRALSEVARPDEPVEATLARILSRPLDPGRPLWEIWLEAAEGACPLRLHFKFHHVVADGIGALALLERILGAETAREAADACPDGDEEKWTAPIRLSDPARRPQPKPPKPASRSARGTRGAGSLLSFVRQHLTRGARTPLTGPVDDSRTYHALRVDAQAIHDWRATLGVSANDALLALVASALERWLSRESDAPLPAHLRAFCPVNLRTRGERAGGNRIAPWFVPLPIAQTDLAARARAIHTETRRLRSERAEHGGDRMARLVRRFGAWLAWLGMAVATWRNAFDLVVTNVPGPRSELSLAGGRLSGLAAYPPLFPGQRVCVAVVQTRDRWTLGLHTGFRDEASANRLADALQAVLCDAGITAENPTPPGPRPDEIDPRDGAVADRTYRRS